MHYSRDVARACHLALILILITGCGETGQDTPGPSDAHSLVEIVEDTTTPDPATSPADSVTLVFSRGEEPAQVRRAADAPADVQEALALLVRGPTADEQAAGIHSWFSAETAGTLRSIDVDADGHAVVDFDGLDALIPNASSSAGSRLLLMQLNGTVFQFPRIESVEYRLGGSCDAFGEWLQTGCITQTRTDG